MRVDIITHVSPPARKRDHGSRWFVDYWTEQGGEDFEGFDSIEDAQAFQDAVTAWMERGA